MVNDDDRASRYAIQSEREAMAERLYRALSDVSDWGDTNVVQLNTNKTRPVF